MMKRTSKQLLSVLLAIVMVIGLMAPAMAARPMGESAAVVEAPASDATGAKLSGTVRPSTTSVAEDTKAELADDTTGGEEAGGEEAGGETTGDEEVAAPDTYLLNDAVLLAKGFTPSSAQLDSGTVTTAGKNAAGTDKEYFTVKWGTKGRFDTFEKDDSGNPKSTELKDAGGNDAGSVSNRFDFQGATSMEGTPAVMKSEDRTVSFTTKYPAKLSVWFTCTSSGKTDRFLQICSKNSDGKYTRLSDTACDGTANVVVCKTLTLNDAGTYFLAMGTGALAFLQIKVEELNAKVYDLTVDKETELLPVGALTGTTEVSDFYTITADATKSNVKSSAKQFPDGDTYTNYIDFGGPCETTGLASRSLTFTATEKCSVQVWWAASDKGRPLLLQTVTVDGEETKIETLKTSEGGTVKGDTYLDTWTGLPAGRYRVSGNKPFIYRVAVYYGIEPKGFVDSAWDADTVGTPTLGDIAVNAEDAGTLDVPVSGVMIGSVEGESAYTNYAKSVEVAMSQGEDVLDTVSITDKSAKTDTNTVSFEPDATGTYTFTATAIRGSNTLAGASKNVDFILPLAVPSINSVASTGNVAADKTVGVKVAWGSVPEASSYKLYVKALPAAAEDEATPSAETTIDWTDVEPIPVEKSATSNVEYEVTGLTAGTEYAFAVEALRDGDTINGVAVTASTTAKSAVETAVAVGVKQIPWTAKVFGTSSTDEKNSVIEGIYEKNFQVIATDDGKGNVTYFPSTDHSEKYENLTGDLNTDPEGRVLLSSREGAGKITEPSGSDGLLFYYTPVPAGYNFSIKAKVHVTHWQTRDTQNGLGLAALDRVPAKSWTGSVASNGADFWNNSYMAGAARLSFSWDSKTGKAYAKGTGLNGDPGADNYTGYSYYMGLLSITKHGTPKGYDAAGSVASTYRTRRFPLDTRLCMDDITVKYNNQSNRFNTIGNYSKLPAGLSSMVEEGKFMEKYELTDFYLELKKTPSGYVSTAWKVNEDGTQGELLGTNTEYYTKGAAELSAATMMDGTINDNPYVHYDGANGAENAVDQSGYSEKGLTNMDKDFEYVGFFTSRDTDALFSDVTFDMWPQSEDDEAVQTPPITTIVPTLSITSGSTANSEDFTLSISTNVDGWVTIKQNGSVLVNPDTPDGSWPIQADVRLDQKVTLQTGSNSFSVSLKVDGDMEMPDKYTVLDLTPPKDATSSVMFKRTFETLNNLYVSPVGRDTGRATKASPLDIYTAVSVVRPGQNIILMDGEYKLTKTIRIPRGMNGVDGTVTKSVTRLNEDTEELETEEVEVDGRIFMLAEPGAHVVLNGQRSVGSIIITGGNYWVFKDFEVVGSSGGSTAMIVSGNHNLVQGIKIHDNGGTGLLIGRLSSSDKYPVRPTPETVLGEDADWGEWPCYNTILNCDSYRNYDSGYNGADGFAAKETAGWGNVFDGCVAYWNADDGWDLFAKSEIDKGCLGVVTLKNCITFQNGFEVRKIINPTTQTPEYQEGSNYLPVMNTDADGNIILSDAGNGNGFKMGGNHLPGAHEISNSYSFYNKAKGFDSNNGPDIHVTGCTGYNNGDENVGLDSKSPTAYVVSKVVSFKDAKSLPSTDGDYKMMADAIKSVADSNGKENNKIDTATYYKWTGDEGSCTNGTKTLTAANFVSLDFDNTKWVDGAVRKDDGTLDLGDFLQLQDVSDAGAGELVNDTTPVEDPALVVDPPVEGNNNKPSAPGGGGGTGAGTGTGTDTPSTDTPSTDTPATVDPAEDFTATSTTDAEGNKEIVVKDEDGEVVAEVQIPVSIGTAPFKFIDVPDDHWAADSINNMAGLGIVKGVSMNEATNEGVYDMTSSVTRGTIATMLYRFANGKEGKTNIFTDVANGVWYTDGIAWAASTGVVKGYSADTFGPEDTITREQLAIMLYRFAQLVGVDTAVKDGALAGYTDAASVDSWASTEMAWAVSSGIINGVSADTLSPTTTATRAQVAVMLDRFVGLLAK